MNKGNKNIFDETVDTLIKDAKALTERYNKYVSAEVIQIIVHLEIK